MNQLIQLIKELKNPPKEFTPVPFWFFNDMPDEHKIREQLTDYVEKGVNGIVLHPRIGVPKEVPYLSEEYFKAVRFIVKTAAELEMKVVLYDEGMYPSGSAHGQVVAANPDFASKGIRFVTEEELSAWQKKAENGGQTPCVILEELPDGRKLAYGPAGGTIRGIHFGEDDGEPGAPKAADILNPNAVDLFIHLTHDRYYEELSEYFGSTVIAFFTDEPSAMGRNTSRYRAWVPGMEQELTEQGGSLIELEGLFTKQSNETTDIYHKLIKKYLREIFYARLSNWCESKGIALMGHPAESDDIEEELYFQIPGQDLIMRRVAPETGGITEFDSVQAKLPADIARHLGRRRNANECFGVCNRNKIPWYFTGEDMKWYINWLGIRGVNLFVPHAFYYSVTGKRKDERPPDVGPNNIWWKHYRRISDYIKRISCLMTDSVNGARVAVLCDNNKVPYKEITYLYENQIEFNYLPAAMLSQCQVKDGKLCIREYAYDTVLDVSEGVWSRQLPAESSASDSQLTAGFGVCTVYAAEEITERTVYTKERCPDLRVTKLVKNGVTMYLLSNEGKEPIDTVLTDIRMKPGQMPLWMDMWTGKWYSAVQPAGNIPGINCELPLHIAPCEMKLLLLAEESLTELENVCNEDFSFSSPNIPDWTERFTLVQKANNQAVYTMTYNAAEENGTCVFQVQGEEMAECYCDGTFVDMSLYGPHIFDLTSCLHSGLHEICLVLTGNAANIYEDAGIPYGLTTDKKHGA